MRIDDRGGRAPSGSNVLLLAVTAFVGLLALGGWLRSSTRDIAQRATPMHIPAVAFPVAAGRGAVLLAAALENEARREVAVYTQACAAHRERLAGEVFQRHRDQQEHEEGNAFEQADEAETGEPKGLDDARPGDGDGGAEERQARRAAGKRRIARMRAELPELVTRFEHMVIRKVSESLARSNQLVTTLR